MSSNSGSQQATQYLIRCPQCDKPSSAIKVITLPIILWAIFFFYVFRRTIAACPSCQRTNIGFYALLNLPSLHLLWPIVYVPLIVYFLARTLLPGHSQDVYDYMRLRR
jgi:hypothetical protein